MKEKSNKGNPSLFSPELKEVVKRLRNKEPELEEIIKPLRDSTELNNTEGEDSNASEG